MSKSGYIEGPVDGAEFYRLVIFALQKGQSIAEEGGYGDILQGEGLSNRQNVLNLAMRMQSKPTVDFIDVFNLATLVNRGDHDLMVGYYAPEYGFKYDVTDTQKIKPWF